MSNLYKNITKTGAPLTRFCQKQFLVVFSRFLRISGQFLSIFYRKTKNASKNPRIDQILPGVPLTRFSQKLFLADLSRFSIIFRTVFTNFLYKN